MRRDMAKTVDMTKGSPTRLLLQFGHPLMVGNYFNKYTVLLTTVCGCRSIFINRCNYFPFTDVHVHVHGGCYSKIGPGFAGFYKPDLVAYGATQYSDRSVPRDPFSIVLAPRGGFFDDCGTSFTAPVVAGDLAELSSVVPNSDVILVQALLYNGAQQLWDTRKISQDEADYIGNLYGRGLSDPQVSKYSSPHRVSFLRTGTLNRLSCSDNTSSNQWQ
jgi:hypothetical protein